MKNKKINTKINICILITITMLICACQEQEKLTIITYLQDTSDSIPNSNCLQNLLHEISIKYSQEETITITTFATGDKTTTYEPKLISKNEVKRKTDFVNGPKAAKLNFDKAKEEITTKWQNIPQTSESPIYQAIKRAIQQIQTNQGNTKTTRIIYIKSDLKETIFTELKQMLNNPNTKKKQHNIPKINNEEVQVIFIGTAQTIGKTNTIHENLQNVENIQQIWQNIFTNPDLVQFQPFCQ